MTYEASCGCCLGQPKFAFPSPDCVNRETGYAREQHATAVTDRFSFRGSPQASLPSIQVGAHELPSCEDVWAICHDRPPTALSSKPVARVERKAKPINRRGSKAMGFARAQPHPTGFRGFKS